MYNFIQKFHSGWAYIALLMLIVTVINAAIGLASKKQFSPRDRQIALYALIATHIQLIVGLIIYFLSPLGFAALSSMGMKAVTQDPNLRLTAVEHPFTNLIAVTLITIGWSVHKRREPAGKKYRSILIFYVLGLLLILSRIPWHLWM